MGAALGEFRGAGRNGLCGRVLQEWKRAVQQRRLMRAVLNRYYCTAGTVKWFVLSLCLCDGVKSYERVNSLQQLCAVVLGTNLTRAECCYSYLSVCQLICSVQLLCEQYTMCLQVK
jgi:hypothetical protein